MNRPTTDQSVPPPTDGPLESRPSNPLMEEMRGKTLRTTPAVPAITRAPTVGAGTQANELLAKLNKRRERNNEAALPPDHPTPDIVSGKGSILKIPGKVPQGFQTRSQTSPTFRLPSETSIDQNICGEVPPPVPIIEGVVEVVGEYEQWDEILKSIEEIDIGSIKNMNAQDRSLLGQRILDLLDDHHGSRHLKGPLREYLQNLGTKRIVNIMMFVIIILSKYP